MSILTEAMIESAAEAMHAHEWADMPGASPKIEDDFPDYWKRHARAALEAAFPDILERLADGIEVAYGKEAMSWPAIWIRSWKGDFLRPSQALAEEKRK